LRKKVVLQLAKEFLTFYGTPEICYRVPHGPPLSPILTQINSFFALPIDLFNVYFNIFLPTTFRSSKWSVSFRIIHQIPILIYVLAYAPPISHLDSITPCLVRTVMKLLTEKIFSALYYCCFPSISTFLN
jgi:hypothetical protein